MLEEGTLTRGYWSLRVGDQKRCGEGLNAVGLVDSRVFALFSVRFGCEWSIDHEKCIVIAVAL